jgi:hypothetical protein
MQGVWNSSYIWGEHKLFYQTSPRQVGISYKKWSWANGHLCNSNTCIHQSFCRSAGLTWPQRFQRQVPWFDVAYDAKKETADRFSMNRGNIPWSWFQFVRVNICRTTDYGTLDELLRKLRSIHNQAAADHLLRLSMTYEPYRSLKYKSKLVQWALFW